MDIVLATRNRKKAEELSRILGDLDVRILTLDDFPSCPEVIEDRDTFEGNAVKKAAAIAQCTGTMAVADDSGLEVAVLNGAPGVLSARYAGEHADDAANLEKLLGEMQNVPDGQRGARFVCCIAFAAPASGEEGVKTFFGFVEGTIGREPKGQRGFGYDPVFYPEGHDRTFAEMGPEEKDTLSHRRRALEQLKSYLKEFVR
ncbi:MAG: XTP/dITP diphosphatase [Nitrospirota bacterium]